MSDIISDETSQMNCRRARGRYKERQNEILTVLLMNTTILGVDDLSRMTERTAGQVTAALDGWALPSLPYRELTKTEASEITAGVERSIEEGKLRRSGEDDPTVWVHGWGEVAARLRNQTITEDLLRPQYFRGEPTCRYMGRYIRPLEAGFEYDVGLALRRIIFDEFVVGHDSVVEFGCGTGINLLLLATRFADVKLVGADWAPVCKDILAEMGRQKSLPISGEVFNMLTAQGWDGREIDPNTLCLTVHAMEQLGTSWQAFADFLIARRPGLCLHIEPIFELYDETSSFDDRARRYHEKRGYLRGFHPYVMRLCREGRGELVASRRITFGGLYHEAYSVLAWRPRG
jgi:hypothetical protein